MNQIELKKQIKKIHDNQKVKWEQQFPSVYGEKKFNGNNKKNIEMAIKELRQIPLTEIRTKAQKMGLMYVISQNNHDNKWGLDKQNSPEGGGIIAQSKTYLGCVKRAKDEFGIHPIFIYGVGVDGW